MILSLQQGKLKQKIIEKYEKQKRIKEKLKEIPETLKRAAKPVKRKPEVDSVKARSRKVSPQIILDLSFCFESWRVWDVSVLCLTIL